MSVDDVRPQVQAWLADEIDPLAADELRKLQGRADAGDAAATAELADRFAGPLTFGTAGLRGPMRAGPNGMNRAVVRRAAAGFAAWLQAKGAAGRPVVVGFDGRHLSEEFARDSAAIFAAQGFDARLMPRLLPTPVLAFAVRHLDAAAGVMVTASHNPPQDNGYKVYVGDGAQIVPPVDAEIETAIGLVGPVRDIPLADTVTVLDESIVDDYVTAVAGLLDLGPRALRIVHTAMHGVGTEVLSKVFAAARFDPLIKVSAQAAPDPDFPTVSFPNPEEPGAMDLALALARDEAADLVLANDPDADRCAVGVTGRRAMADAARRRGRRATGRLAARARRPRHLRDHASCRRRCCARWRSSTVSDTSRRSPASSGSPAPRRISPSATRRRSAMRSAPYVVRDKDGISAALFVAACAAELAERGSSLTQRLEELATEYGRYATDQVSVRVDDLAVIASTMARLRAAPPKTLLGQQVRGR